MLAGMSATLFDEWITYASLEPFGEERADLRAARITWAALQPHSRRTLNERDFLLDFEPHEAPDWQTLKQRAMLLTAASGGQILPAHNATPGA